MNNSILEKQIWAELGFSFDATNCILFVDLDEKNEIWYLKKK